jgi:hypothetical protein
MPILILMSRSRYLMVDVPTTKGAQFGFQHTVTAFAGGTKTTWLALAKKLVRWPHIDSTTVLPIKTDDVHFPPPPSQLEYG